MLSDGSVDHRYLSPHVFRCSVTIKDDYILPLKFVSGVVRFTYSGTELIVWVLDGLITQPLPLLFDLYDGPVDQCVTLTPSSFVSPEQAPLVSGVEKINVEQEDP